MSNTKKATGNPIDEFLEQAAPAECEIELCLDASLRDRHQAAELDLARLLAESPVGITEDARKLAADRLAAAQFAAAEMVQEIEQEMDANATVFRLRNLSWLERGAITGVHPPREGNDGDKIRGFNRAEVYPALVAKGMVSITLPGKEPTEVTPEQWERFAAVLEPDQMEQLAAAMIQLVWRPADPKSQIASQLLRTRSGARSKPPARSGSPTSGS